jgi:hypothetical protein
MYSQIKVELRANNQITITRGNWRKKEKEVSQNPVWLHDRIHESEWKDKKQDIIAKRETYEYIRRIDPISKRPPLDITKKSQRCKKPLSMRLNRPKNFTAKSGQKLRECGAAVDIACDGDTRFCHEVTLTLPANHEQAFRVLAAYSGYVVNRLFQPIRRNYGEMCLWFFVWEYQKRGALHMHICIYHPDECEGLYIAAQLIAQWHKILCDLCQMADTDMFCRRDKKSSTPRHLHQHHTSPIKKAVGAYFSKYAGKKESKQSWYCQKYPVSRFWGSSKQIKQIIKDNSFSFDLDFRGDTNGCEERYFELLNEIAEKLSIVSASSYSFLVGSTFSHSFKKYKNGRKIVNHIEGKIFAEGIRDTLYIESSDLREAIRLLNVESAFG